MARKSRKLWGKVIDAPVSESSALSTAVYVRLSVENSGKKDDGDSIANQISLCMDYLSEHTDLKFYGIYEDNGEKGTNFDRPEFKRMLEDVKAGYIKCILVKDLSRFGRDYIEAGEYLEKIFPFMGVRFIAVTDGYDSFTSSDAMGALAIPLKNMINDVYAKDISRKIITSFQARQEKGDILPSFAPYGYVKSEVEAYRYEVDPIAAPYVRMIFEWKAEGVSHREICNRLTEMGAVTPARRKVELGIWRAEKYKHTAWNSRSIIDIMKNPTYTGCIVYGRILRSLCDGVKKHRTPEDAWRYVFNAHEPIVSQELFDRVQSMFANRAESFQKVMDERSKLREQIVDHFKGKLFCGDCGKRMRFVKWNNRSKQKDQSHSYYVCGAYADKGPSGCSGHFIKYQVLADAVFEVIKAQAALALDQERLIRQMKGSVKEKSLLHQYTDQINSLVREQNRINSKRERLFENFIEGILDEGEYLSAKKKYDQNVVEIGKELEKIRAKKLQIDRVLSLENEWIKSVHMVENMTKFDESLIVHMVHSIRIFEENKIEIKLNYAEQKSIFEQIVSAVKGDIHE